MQQVTEHFDSLRSLKFEEFAQQEQKPIPNNIKEKQRTEEAKKNLLVAERSLQLPSLNLKKAKQLDSPRQSVKPNPLISSLLTSSNSKNSDPLSKQREIIPKQREIMMKQNEVPKTLTTQESSSIERAKNITTTSSPFDLNAFEEEMNAKIKSSRETLKQNFQSLREKIKPTSPILSKVTENEKKISNLKTNESFNSSNSHFKKLESERNFIFNSMSLVDESKKKIQNETLEWPKEIKMTEEKITEEKREMFEKASTVLSFSKPMDIKKSEISLNKDLNQEIIKAEIVKARVAEVEKTRGDIIREETTNQKSREQNVEKQIGQKNIQLAKTQPAKQTSMETLKKLDFKNIKSKIPQPSKVNPDKTKIPEKPKPKANVASLQKNKKELQLENEDAKRLKMNILETPVKTNETIKIPDTPLKSDEEEERMVKNAIVPTWAKTPFLKKTLETQVTKDPKEIFGVPAPKRVDIGGLVEVFYNKEELKKHNMLKKQTNK
ncbi:hypothetical protein ROZALSC1DRAFT_26589 [Rozella allomycis CSF55]|uniref:Inner centromere protein ARK-binding domain-containing protein n=1 Tax=Rozella allomycis (strain CSF55) TaxID=988480 RepID=A0A4P9YQS5_ROZAC|nr:hypothetical protein ROZALSC1DRAFT_26589 [Rozella allomycis CSF55]